MCVGGISAYVVAFLSLLYNLGKFPFTNGAGNGGKVNLLPGSMVLSILLINYFVSSLYNLGELSAQAPHLN